MDRGGIAISAWWLVILGLALAFLPLRPPPRPAFVVGFLLAGFAVWTALSMTWAESAERAFSEFNRAMLYLGLFVLVALASDRRRAGSWVRGLAAGVAAIGLIALASRLFPGLFPAGDIPRFLPSARTRLSYPLGYWNALGIFCGLGFPLLVAAALSARSRILRGLAVAPLPALAAVIYLTSSRGGVGAALVGLVAFVAFARLRLAAVWAILFAAVGSAGAVGVLVGRHELVNGPLDSPAAAAQGRGAALLIALICVAVGVAYAYLAEVGHRPLGVDRRLRLATATVAAFAVVASVVAVDPAQSFETFKDPPVTSSAPERDFVRAHLLSGSGSGRWQFWGVALDQFRDAPVVGQGAGSYEAFWAQHAPYAYFIRDAHSLYLEVLGELGVVGFLLIAGALAFTVVVGVRRLRDQDDDGRIVVAALTASLLAWMFGAAVDWVWEMTAVSAVAVACLALLTGPATATAGPPESSGAGDAAGEPAARSRRSNRAFGLGVAVIVVAWLAICAQAIPLLARAKIDDSQRAAARGDVKSAVENALAARTLQPWAASPYLQLALVQEDAGEVRAARASIERALERDAVDWRLWLVAARIAAKDGDLAAARRGVSRAKSLNPKSPILASLGT